jgi:hypothetical protein
MITPLRATAHLLTRDKVRRIAANIAQLPDSSPGRPASRKNLKPCCLRGAFRGVPPRKDLKPCCANSGEPCTYLAA